MHKAYHPEDGTEISPINDLKGTMIKTKETFATPWKKVADNWEKYYAPPGRPSKEDRLHYARFIERSLSQGQNRVLVLGATPEVRNVLHQFPIDVTIMDINLEMILAMSHSVPRSECDAIVCASWTDDLLAENYFDMVIGDLTWANLPRDQWKCFHQNVSRMLKPGGYYIQRVTVMPTNWQIVPTEQTLDLYERLSLTPQRHFELMFHLLFDTYDSKTHTLSMNRLWDNLKPFWTDGHLVDGQNRPNVALLLQKISAFWGEDSKTWQTDYPDQLHRSIDSYFEPLEEVLSSDYLYPETSPFWFSQVKK